MREEGVWTNVSGNRGSVREGEGAPFRGSNCLGVGDGESDRGDRARCEKRGDVGEEATTKK